MGVGDESFPVGGDEISEREGVEWMRRDGCRGLGVGYKIEEKSLVYANWGYSGMKILG